MTLSADELARLDAYWRAANYLSVGQIYLLDNPLLREPLRLEHIKPRLLGHWGTTPGLNFVYAHLNRVIRQRDLDVIYVTGPGHGGPALVANTYLEGTYSEVYPDIVARRGRACGGCSGSSRSRAASPATSRPRRPARSTRAASSATRSSHAYGAAFDNPDLIVLLRDRRRRGRDRPAGHELALQQVPRPGRATARCCRSCTSTATRSPTRPCSRGSPTTSCARCSSGYGYAPVLRRAATTRGRCTSRWPPTLDAVLDEIAAIQRGARRARDDRRGRAGR